MINVKEGVEFRILRPEIWKIFDCVDWVFKCFGVVAVITCGTDNHDDHDPHTHGFAIDLRTHDVKTRADKNRIVSILQDRMGPLYYVLLEDAGGSNEHIHIQVRKQNWPLLVGET